MHIITIMGHGRLCLYVVVFLAAVTCCAGITVTVDPDSDANCSSVQALFQDQLNVTSATCRSLDQALGGHAQACSNISCASGDVQDFDGAVIRLADGIHELSGKVSLL